MDTLRILIHITNTYLTACFAPSLLADADCSRKFGQLTPEPQLPQVTGLKVVSARGADPHAVGPCSQFRGSQVGGGGGGVGFNTNLKPMLCLILGVEVQRSAVT